MNVHVIPSDNNIQSTLQNSLAPFAIGSLIKLFTTFYGQITTLFGSMYV